MHEFTERDVAGDPDGRAASDWLRRHYLRVFVDRYEKWLDDQADWPLDWQDSAGASDWAIRVSPTRLATVQRRDVGAGRALPTRGGRARRGEGPGPHARLPAHEEPTMTALDTRSVRAPLPHPGRAPLAADRTADPGHRPACTVARAVPHRDRPRLQYPGPGRPRPRAADRRADRRPRSAADPDPGQPRRPGLARSPLRRRFRWRCSRRPAALQGVFRALDSGPLEAWYVDATLAAEPGAEIEHGLSAGSTVLSLAIACGALVSGGLVALDPFDAIPTLALPAAGGARARRGERAGDHVALMSGAARGPRGAGPWPAAGAGGAAVSSPTASACCASSRAAPGAGRRRAVLGLLDGDLREPPSRSGSRRSPATRTQAAATDGAGQRRWRGWPPPAARQPRWSW